MKSRFYLTLSILVLISFVTTSCLNFSNFWGDDDDIDTTPPTYSTEILRVDIEPNPVVAGDSIQFTCVIKDSLDPAFNFQWHILPSDTVWQETQSNTFKIKSPNEIGSYDGMVGVYNYDESSKAVPYESFTYDVVER